MQSPILAIVLLLAQQTPYEKFDVLIRQADQLTASAELDLSESIVNDALILSTHLGPKEEAQAQLRIYELFEARQKRAGGSWRLIALPHLLSALENTSKSPYGDLSDQLAARYALMVVRSMNGKFKEDSSSRFEKFLTEWIAEQETESGPLTPGTAIAYQALANFPDDSRGQRQALNACGLLIQTDQISSEFIPLLSDCADARERAHSYQDAIAMAQFTRRLGAGNPRWTYESILSQIIESEANAANHNFAVATELIAAASSSAKAAIAPQHEIWERIFKAVAAASPKTAAAVQAKRDLKTWAAERSHSNITGRVQSPKVLKQVEPIYTDAAKANHVEGSTTAHLIVNPDGSSRLLATYGHLPGGLEGSAAKALAKWRFQPCQLDKKPVACAATVEVSFRLGM